MNVRSLFGALTVITLLFSCTSKNPFENTEKIEAECKTLVENESSRGIALSMEVDTFIAIRKEYGLANNSTKLAISENDKFRIASITKPITATAILQLVESRLLSLEDKLDKFFPDYPNGDEITIYQLLSHTSGIPDWWEAGMPKNTPVDFPMCSQPHLYLEQMEKNALFEPGTFFSYSNTGYVLLGEIIELISKMKYEDYLSKNIFSIAGMQNTELEYIENPQVDWVSGYTKTSNSELPFSAPETYPMPFSAGGLRSTTKDLLLFLNALEGEKLISKEMFVKMTSYAKVKNGRATHESIFIHNGEKPRFPSNIKKFGYGLGFQIIENFGVKTISHGGDIAGFNSVLIYIPHNKVKIAILSNTENGIMSKLRRIEKLATSIESLNNGQTNSLKNN